MSTGSSGGWAEQKLRRIEVFWDTMDLCAEDATLADSIRTGIEHTILYAADAYPALPAAGDGARGEIRVTRKRTLEAAGDLHREFPQRKIAALNFASAIQPGGGVKNGSSAQEECLCRCSTLYPVLDQEQLWKSYYNVNRAKRNALHTDDCIYTPGILVCKTDELIPQRLPAGQFFAVDVITCAAPDLHDDPVCPDAQRLFAIHLSRARHILHVAAANGVRILVLGAFGCGAFANDPAVVATAFREALTAYRTRFDVIEFAIYCRGSDTQNYDAFLHILQ